MSSKPLLLRSPVTHKTKSSGRFSVLTFRDLSAACDDIANHFLKNFLTWPLRQSLGFLFPHCRRNGEGVGCVPFSDSFAGFSSKCEPLGVFFGPLLFFFDSLGICSNYGFKYYLQIWIPRFLSLAQTISQTLGFICNCLFDSSTRISNRHLKLCVQNMTLDI